MLDSTFAFDRPLFKRLAHNDTGQAVGHQAGVLIPKDMDSYFPQLVQIASAVNPVPSVAIIAELFDGATYLDTVETRYQYQTWGATRSPERRITANLSPMRDLARKDDILLIERGITDPSRYRLTLARRGSALFQTISAVVGTRPWGPLDKADPPSSELQTLDALDEIVIREQAAFTLFEEDAGVVVSKSKRIARSRAFQSRLLDLYGPLCAMCGGGLKHPKGTIEVEAAHIVPRGLKGADDPRNGLMLCRQHHWALDYGLLGIDDQRRVIVPVQTRTIACNAVLNALHEQSLRAPLILELQPTLDSVRWHRENILIQ
jgi:putative restriction endonuclease